MTVEIDPERLRAWRLFLTAQARLLPVLADELQAERNLPLPWYEVLLWLNEAPGRRLRLQELARTVLLSQSRITRLVDDMVRAGLVRREASEQDRRSTYAVLTDAGKRTLRAAAPVHLRGIHEHFTSHLTDEEAERLASALEKVLAGLDAPTPEPAGSRR